MGAQPSTYLAYACAALAHFFTLACSSAPKAAEEKRATPPMTQEDSLEFRKCQADSDCVYVQNGCCDCANGGEAIAVHRDKVQAFKAKFDCSTASCTLRGALPSCDEGIASCKLGLCFFKRAEWQQP